MLVLEVTKVVLLVDGDAGERTQQTSHPWRELDVGSLAT
jgi:hypothetical protein